jgi:hypothetical protein
MAKTYSVQFGVGDPRTYTGLSPTLLIFVNLSSGATLVAPAFSEALTGSGIYKFAYGTTTPIGFLADAATTSPGAQGRYVTGQIDPNDRSDEYGTTLVSYAVTNISNENSLLSSAVTLIAIGTSTVAFGTSLMAYGASETSTLNSLVSYGVTLLAIGTSTISFGTTLVAYGAAETSTLNSLISYGVTNVALGTTNVALGTTAVAIGTVNTSTLNSLISFGVSSLAQGVSNLAIGTTILAGQVAMGNTILGIGGSLSISFAGIGSTASSFGTASADPTDLFGYMKRIQENLEGNSAFTKLTGAWNINSRGGSLLIAKTVANSSSQVIKT